MRRLIPLSDKLVQLGTQVVFGCKLDEFEAWARQDAESLCHVIHPCALHGRAGHDTARLLGEPVADLLPRMRADVVAHQMDHRDVRIHLAVQLFPKGHVFLLPFAISTVPLDLAGAGIKGRQERERPSALALVCAPGGQVPWRGWPG
jgi:hypothetical protein